MSELGDDLTRWLDEAGFEPAAEDGLDDPWADVVLAPAPLTPAQLAHLERSTQWLATDEDLEAGGAGRTD